MQTQAFTNRWFATIVLTATLIDPAPAADFPTYSFTTLAGMPALAGSADGIGQAARFWQPKGGAVDHAGNFYVADSRNYTIRRISPSGIVSTLAGLPQSPGRADGLGDSARFALPGQLAGDSTGNLYVTDGDIVRRITPAGGVSTVAGGGSVGAPAVGPATIARLEFLRAVVVDPADHVFILLPNCILRLDGGVLTEYAGRVAAYGSVDGPGATARFSALAAAAAGPDGSLYVADGTRIRRVFPTGEVATVAGDSTAGVRDGPARTARFRSPCALAVDAAGNVFVAESSDDGDPSIRVLQTDGEVVTIGGHRGSPGSADGVGTQSRFFQPSGIAVDSAGQIYVADTRNNLIRRGTPVSLPAPAYISNQPFEQSQEVAVNSAVSFSAAASGTGIAYQWRQDGQPIAGATSSTYSIADATAASQGAYSVEVSNGTSSEQAVIGVLTVNTPDFGSLLTRHTAPGGSFLWGIASGRGRLVAVGTGGAILTSVDGVTWARAESGTTDWLVGIAFGRDQFVAVGDNGRILRSTDGLAWTPVASGTSNRLNNVIYVRGGAGKFVAVGEAGTIIESPDAITWTTQDSGVTGWLRGLATDGWTVFASGQDRTMLASGVSYYTGHVTPPALIPGWVRSDGETLFGRAPATADLEASAAVSSVFVSIGGEGTEVDWAWHNLPGYGWTRTQPTGANLRLRGLVSAANVLFATGEQGTVLTARGPGRVWARIPTATRANLVAGVYHNNSLFVVGEDETILQSSPFYHSRLTNISTRGFAGAGVDTLISGFVISGDQPKRVLLRAAGPSLAALGVPGALSATSLTLYDGSGTAIAANQGWSTSPDASEIASAAGQHGAFSFPSGSADSAILATLNPGAYTTHVSGTAGQPGLALVEVYDAEGLEVENRRAVNISSRGRVGNGANRLIAGFVIGGTATRRVLIRAVGPSLVPLGLSDVLAKPRLELYDGSLRLVDSAESWSSDSDAESIRNLSTASGAFPLTEGSDDAAIVTSLPPGSWTVHVTGADGGEGTALVEVYDVP